MTLAEGELVELTGIATPLADPLEAPLTGEPCIAHLSLGRVYNRLDHVGDHLGDVERLEVAPFRVATPSGSVRVIDRPTIVSLQLVLLAWVEPTRAARFLADRGLSPFVMSSFFEQALVRPGEEVTVTGVVTREAQAAQESGFRELQLQTRLTGYGRNPLTLRKTRAG